MTNYWNTTKQSGINIIDGAVIGGNYYEREGSGYGETCTNAESDEFCDSPYTLGADNVDYLPLSNAPVTNPIITVQSPLSQVYASNSTWFNITVDKFNI